MAETIGVCGGSSVLASIGTSTFECSLVDCSGSLDVSHDGSFDDFCEIENRCQMVSIKWNALNIVQKIKCVR